MYKSATSLIISAILLGGCADMGNIHFKSTLMNVEKHAGSDKSDVDVKFNWPQQTWWSEYGDAQLDALMQQALSNSPSLKEAAARARRAEAATGLAESAHSPKVEAGASFERQLFSEHDFIPAPEAGNYAWYNRIALEAGYDLDLWGRHKQAIAAALAQQHVADAEQRLAALTLEGAIVQSYVQLAQTWALKELTTERLEHQKKAVDVMQKRLAAGLSSAVELTQEEAALPPLQLELAQLDERIAVLQYRLTSLAGKQPQESAALQRPSLAFAHVPALPDNLPADLLGRRPDIAASRWYVESAARRIDVARAAFYPDINLKAFIGFQSIGFGTMLDGSSSVRGVGPAISLPIFDGGALRSNLGARTAEYDMAVESYNTTLLKALESVSTRLAIAQSVHGQLALNEQALRTAKQTNTLARKGVAAGMTDYLVLLRSESTLLARQQDQIRLQARLLESHAELMLALGGGLAPAALPVSGDAISLSTHHNHEAGTP